MSDPRELAAQHRQEVTAPAKEVLEHLYRTLFTAPAFTLSNGVKVQLAPYYAPQLDEDGNAACGVDAWLEDGTQLEFTMTNTGWGRSLIAGLARKHGKEGHER